MHAEINLQHSRWLVAVVGIAVVPVKVAAEIVAAAIVVAVIVVGSNSKRSSSWSGVI